MPPSESPPQLQLVIVDDPSRAFPIIPDRPLVFGRSDDCDVVVADTSLSRRHFEVRQGDYACVVRDLGSTNGLYVNGRKLQRAAIRPGDILQAGDVRFRVERLERGRPLLLPLYPDVEPTLAAADETAWQSPAAAALRDALAAEQPLYALIDGAQSFDLAFSARLMGHTLFTVFAGELARVTAQVGPILVVVGERSGFLRRWAEYRGKHAGVLFQTPAELHDVVMHLRHVFVVTDETEQEYFFRYYDPRVFRTFLPTCRPEELQEFFGPVEQWVVETAGGEYAVHRLRSDATVDTRVIAATDQVWSSP